MQKVDGSSPFIRLGFPLSRATLVPQTVPTTEVKRAMSIVVRFSPTNVNREKYDESLRRLEQAGLWPNPAGLELHVAFGDEDNMRVSEIWASREQFQAYGESLMPILSDVGIEFSGEPEVFEAHNLVKS